ncbi:helix-turn-helix domain-containing protein [Halomarina ordinaria]|uniref:Helix-turn-helix domain-containing protein n=1 Tax=Halomarina ordinaria TaxID=3033939 RepID=A0ABD5U9I0_9EURY|nr:helix-turn-helix domain-containing protein [Halomarina sp. PSRA2]
MSVIAELRIPATAFELGRTLDVRSGTALELESVVPLGDSAVPFVWMYRVDDRTGAAERGSAVSRDDDCLEPVDVYDDRALYAVEWNLDTDDVFSAVRAEEGHVLRATAVPDRWTFKFRFPDHESLSAFRRHCRSERIPLEVLRVRSPETPGRPRFGLTDRQRETLSLAVQRGYYAIPRQCTTIELAETLGISDQAVTERLRRAIVALVEDTLGADERDGWRD